MDFYSSATNFFGVKQAEIYKCLFLFAKIMFLWFSAIQKKT